ncbi:hypothetical protein LshimejAT787_3900110 [Lyophyllum shimeji]|uniref:AB hydrolase-1 domain-containing protein n=1 Tax=Lyophyllum shimeji TaxID=47721 RepID=A0A9P3Q1J5_LYOSH|nr:hypothetical protein LshimejAT787_3900110 [Lyophyllum shimeji]
MPTRTTSAGGTGTVTMPDSAERLASVLFFFVASTLLLAALGYELPDCAKYNVQPMETDETGSFSWSTVIPSETLVWHPCYASRLRPLISALVGPQFDVLGFDPRGVGRSTPRASFFETDLERVLWGGQNGIQAS